MLSLKGCVGLSVFPNLSVLRLKKYSDLRYLKFMTPLQSASLETWARGFGYAVLEFASSLCTTDNLQFGIMLGGYLLLRPRIQKFVGTLQISNHDQALGISPTEANMPNASCTGTRPIDQKSGDESQRVEDIMQGEGSMDDHEKS